MSPQSSSAAVTPVRTVCSYCGMVLDVGLRPRLSPKGFQMAVQCVGQTDSAEAGHRLLSLPGAGKQLAAGKRYLRDVY
ncbi:hypothetical protein OG244_06620 [Streptomyces brevispora]|uniref:hypothetical protein n=1 Tax=Streptomyces brevispora TaxID=887462 RepID=UPI002E334204|nr:hypothetical protein [Streptomyces brevispora]